MYILAFDTTSPYCSIALFKNGNRVQNFCKQSAMIQAEILLPEIQKLLDDEKINFTDIQIIASTTGPGSFTGVRSSLAAIRGFGIACPNATIMGINCFDVYANMIEKEQLAQNNLVIIETKRQDFYYQIFDKNKKPICPPKTGTIAEIVEQLKQKETTIIGDAIERFLSQPSGLTLKNISLKDCIEIETLGQLALQRFEEKSYSFPSPLYIKAPDVCYPNS